MSCTIPQSEKRALKSFIVDLTCLRNLNSYITLLSILTEARMVGEIQKSQGYPGETSNIFSWGGVYDH